MEKFIALSLTVLAFVAVNQAYTIQPRIVDGEKAKSGQFPYYAFLDVKLNERGKGSACGASLINNEWVVTAAHCLKDAKSVDVHLGEYQLNNKKPEHKVYKVELKNFHTHPEYKQNMALNDIALLRLPKKVKFTKNIKPVDLPKVCKSPVGLDVVAVGHGKTGDKGGVSLQLNYIQLKTIPLRQCRGLFPIFNFFDTYVCAQSENYGYQSVCNGDSGGPLVTVEDNTLIGVADFVVIEGCETGLPQGFTNVYSYLGWIGEVTGLTLPQC